MSKNSLIDTIVTTPPMRLDYPTLTKEAVEAKFKKKYKGVYTAENEKDKKYSVQLILDLENISDTDKVAYKNLLNVMEEASQKIYKKSLKELPEKQKETVYRFKKGSDNTDPETGEIKKGYEGKKIYLNANTNINYPPKLVVGFKEKQKVISEQEAQEYFYSGAYVRAKLLAKNYDVAGKKGLTFYLNALQFIKDGDKLYIPKGASFDEDLDQEWFNSEDNDLSFDLDDDDL